MPSRVHDIYGRPESLSQNAILLPTNRDRPLEAARQLYQIAGVLCYAAMRPNGLGRSSERDADSEDAGAGEPGSYDAPRLVVIVQSGA